MRVYAEGKGGIKRENVCVLCVSHGSQYCIHPLYTVHCCTVLLTSAHCSSWDVEGEVFQHRLVGKVAPCTSVWRRHVIGQCDSNTSTWRNLLHPGDLRFFHVKVSMCSQELSWRTYCYRHSSGTTLFVREPSLLPHGLNFTTLGQGSVL